MRKLNFLKLLWLFVVISLPVSSLNAQTVDDEGLLPYSITDNGVVYAAVVFTDANENGNFDASITLSETQITTWGDYSTSLAFYDEGLQVRDGGGFTSTNTYLITPGVVYHVWFDVDVSTNTYSTWIKSDADDMTLIHADAGFRKLPATGLHYWSCLHNPAGEPDIVTALKVVNVSAVGDMPMAMYLPGGGDGNNSNIAIPALNISDLPVTIEMKYMPDAAKNNYATLWYNRGGSSNAGFQYDRWTDDTKVKAVWNAAAELPTETPVPGQWNHIAMVVTATSKTLYVNGVATAETGSSFAIYPMDGTTYIGWDNAAVDRTLEGLFDEFRVWNVEKTAQELADDMNKPLTGSEAGLIGYWNFDDGAAVATDKSAGGNDGVITGGVYVDIMDASLSDITTDVGTLTETFDPAVTSYTLTAPYGTTSVTVSPTTSVVYGAAVTVNSPVDVSGGSGTATIDVVAPDGVTTMTYTVDITVDAGVNDATLSDIGVSVAALDPLFHPDSLEYTLIVPIGTPSVDLTATANKPAASVSGDGTVTLSGGSAAASILVTAEDGTTQLTYVVNVMEADGKNYAMRLPGVDGTNSNINISGLGLTTLPFTIEMWFKPEGAQVANTGLIFNRPGNIGMQYTSGWQAGGTSIRFMTTDGGDQYGTITPAVSTDTWHHVAAVLTSTTRTIYLDGVKTVEAGTYSANDYSVGDLFLGWDSGAGNRALNGLMDEVKVWSAELDSATLVDNRFAVLNGDEADLVAYWNFDIPNSVKAIDLAGGLHGLITGGTYEEKVAEVNLSADMIEVEKDYMAFPLTMTTSNITDTVTLTISSGFSVTPAEILPAELFSGPISIEVDAPTATVGDMGTLVISYVKNGIANEVTTVDVKAIEPFTRYYIKHIASDLVIGSRVSDPLIPVLADWVAGDSSQLFSLRPVNPGMNDSTFYIVEDAEYRYFNKQASSGWNTVLGPLEQGEWVINWESGSYFSLTNTANNLVVGTDATTVDSRLYADKSLNPNAQFLFISATDSADARLANLAVDGAMVDGFGADVLSYSILLPEGTTEVPVVSATSRNLNAITVVTQASALPGTATVEVTSADGSATMTYSVEFIIPVAPEMSSLTHSYLFDGNTLDYIGGVHGVLEGGATVGAGSVAFADGQFVSLSGPDINVPSYSEISVEAWFTPEGGTNNSWHTVYSFGKTVSSNNYGAGYFHFQPAREDNVSKTAISTGNESEPWTAEDGVAGPEIDDAAMHHVVSILDASAVHMYLDGEYVGSTAYTGTNAISALSNEVAYFAKGVYGNDPTWKGSIQEVNIYNKALSAGEVAYQFARGPLDGAADPTLSDLTVDAGSLSPTFDPTVTEYSVTAPSGTTSVNVTATATDAGATVTGAGAVDVTGGSGTATITVTSSDGNYSIVYTVSISVEGALNNDAKLSGLTVEPGTLSPTFDPDIINYTASAPQGTTSVTVTATPNDQNATVSGDGVIDVSSGSASVEVDVTAEDGVTTMKYTIDITVLTGIEEDQASFARVYPTVSNGAFMVEFTGKPGMITVYDITGKVVVRINASSTRQMVNVPDAGIYIIHLESEGQNRMVKVVKTN